MARAETELLEDASSIRLGGERREIGCPGHADVIRL